LTFAAEFVAHLSNYKEYRVHCTRHKICTFFAALLLPYGQGRQTKFIHARFEFGLYAPVTFHPNPFLRFAGVIHEKPI